MFSMCTCRFSMGAPHVWMYRSGRVDWLLYTGCRRDCEFISVCLHVSASDKLPLGNRSVGSGDRKWMDEILLTPTVLRFHLPHLQTAETVA